MTQFQKTLPKRPIRLQLSRRKGFRLQAASRAINDLAAAKVDRLTGWGNPFLTEALGRAEAVDAFRRLLTGEMTEPEILSHSGSGKHSDGGAYLRNARDHILHHLKEIRGKNLACWCKDDEPCHAIVLLQLANR